MGKNIAIKVENLSKAYQLGQIGTGTISRDLERFWTTKIRGKEDPFLKIGQTNDRTVKGESDIVWSLKDINFEIEKGDAVGIIGRNGAGKSTLLKLLSRVTAPTTGNIKVKGRIASLLEVGTGFHPELTGRENIYLNGAILGMRKKEITRKFDEIVDFSGVERYIDTPVKRYSSGMYVRLAFAVAAHLESEILIVDEVLAVGDAEFQKKCLGKMGEVSKGEGRTILFVSHNLASVKALCKIGILLENGKMKSGGLVESVVRDYLGGNSDNLNYKEINKINNGFKLVEVSIINTNKQISDSIVRDKEISFIFKYDNFKNIENLYFNIKIKDDDGRYLITTYSEMSNSIIFSGKGSATMKIPVGFFNEGQFFVDLMVIQKNENGFVNYFSETDLLIFQVLPEKRQLGSWMGREVGQIRHTFEWQNDSSN
jgi:lipopolysaccharide transport system ATP-binding protein